MKDTRKLISKVLEEIDSKEEDYIIQLNKIEEVKQEEEYLSNNSISTITTTDELLKFYNNLKSNIELINFKKVISSMIDDEEDLNTFFKELDNLKLLNSTGLFKYAKEQESYSKSIIDKYVEKLTFDKLPNSYNNSEEEVISKLKRIRDFRTYFSPIGIIREVNNPLEFLNVLDSISLDDYTKTRILFMALEFNYSMHENNLKNYTLDLQVNKELTKRRVYVLEEVVKEIDSLLKDKDINYYINKSKDKEIEGNVDSMIFSNDVVFENLDKANEYLIDNKDDDPYNLFVNYYEVLLNEEKVDNSDKKIVDKAKSILDKNIKQLNGLSDVILEDLDVTLNIYKQDENLRELVYKTTENVNRLIAYEIRDVFNKFNEADDDFIKTIAKELKPAVEYLEKRDKEKRKK